jgi:hypothetical protein
VRSRGALSITRARVVAPFAGDSVIALFAFAEARRAHYFVGDACADAARWHAGEIGVSP